LGTPTSYIFRQHTLDSLSRSWLSLLWWPLVDPNIVPKTPDPGVACQQTEIRQTIGAGMAEATDLSCTNPIVPGLDLCLKAAIHEDPLLAHRCLGFSYNFNAKKGALR
jgi:hypothetical protein